MRQNTPSINLCRYKVRLNVKHVIILCGNWFTELNPWDYPKLLNHYKWISYLHFHDIHFEGWGLSPFVWIRRPTVLSVNKNVRLRQYVYHKWILIQFQKSRWILYKQNLKCLFTRKWKVNGAMVNVWLSLQLFKTRIICFKKWF